MSEKVIIEKEREISIELAEFQNIQLKLRQASERLFINFASS